MLWMKLCGDPDLAHAVSFVAEPDPEPLPLVKVKR